MKAANLPQNGPSPEPAYRPLLKFMFYLPILMLFQLWALGQSANLDQGANDKYTTPLSPVDWINGNLNMNTAHFLEGHSVPYRAILKSLVPNQNYTLVIGIDIKHSSKHALDYITHFQRLAPHVQFGHSAETVNPLLSITGFPPAYFTSTDTEPIPAPSSAGSPVPGQPTASFNALPAGERLFTGYNADLLSVTYSSEGDLNGTQSETVIHITFKALTETVVLAWGGHIAAMADWGKDPVTNESRSASGISGSPYHMRLKNWIINGDVVSIGNQDRSLKTDAVIIPPTCEVSGPTNACAETPNLTYVATVDDPTGLTYAWSIIGANTANAQIVNPALGTIQVVPIGTTFTPGFFNLQLIVTRNGFKDTCYLNGHEIPGVSVIIAQVTVDAGTDQAITHLDVASLSASASGGTGVYTYSWTPTTGLSDPNIANPQFTPPSTGTFQFIVTATDGNNCVDKDTVVVNVTEHPKPPCGITGPDPVCPGSKNEYAGPPSADVGSYLWSVTGDASISGDNDKEKVMIQAHNKCGSYIIQLIVSTPDGKVKDTCYLTVNITDTVKPVLSGTVSDATVSCASDVPAAPAVTATDNCVPELNVEMSVTVIDSTCVNRFKVVRKWWATDLCGNTSDTLTQVITVYDDVKPVITADFEKEITVQCLKDIPAPPTPTATDNCNGEVPAVYTAEGSGTACDSTITRKWVFTDACGNSDFVTQVIHIKDNIAPVLTGNAEDVNVVCADDIPAAGNIGATDNCDENPAVAFSQTVIDSTCANRFKVVRKWWAKDACGNTSDTLTQVITVYDDVKPVITADFEREITVQCLKDIPAPPTPTATDNCNGEVPAVYTAEGSGTACDSTITRKWVFTDACGNSDYVTQVIHIKDNIAPVLTGTAGDVNVVCADDIPAAGNIGATDNCDENPAVAFSQTVIDSTCANRFKVVRKWWAKDACGNTSDTLTQVITVYDDVKPVITADFEKEITVQCLKDIPAPPAPTATDNCNGEVPAVCSAEGSGTACDSTITRKWVFTDACGNSDYVTQVIHIKDNIAPVLTGTAGDVNATCADEIPAAGNIGATDNCDENPAIAFSQTVIDSTCANRFKVVRKWWAKDACGNTSDTLTQVITVYDDVKPVITADFEREITVQCLKDIPAPPTPTATDNCNGEVPAVYTAEGSGTACDSTITRMWVFTDACGNSDYVTQVIRIKDDIAPVATFQPGNVTLPCNSPVEFGEPVFTDNCDGDVTVTYEDRSEGTACPFTHIRKWTAKDACGNSTWVEQSIVVECCKESFCTYTIGFYGNTGGKGCTPSGVQSTSKLMMIAAVDAQPGDSVFFGLKSTGKFFTLFLGDITNDNIFKMLPGGGTPVALKGYSTFNKTNTWSFVPILTTKSNYGKINNILLAQTMALFFNMELSPSLKNLPIEGDSLFTVKILACGSTATAALADTFLIPASVVNYLKSIGKANVLGLYELANMYLGGQTVSGVTISNVNAAVDAINRGFDRCAFLVGWANSSATLTLRSTNNVAMSNNSDAKVVESTVASNSFAVKVFPNPYSDKLIFHFVAPVKGTVNLEMFNVLGQRVGQRNYGVVEKGSANTIEYKTSARQNITLLYRLRVGNHIATGKAIHE